MCRYRAVAGRSLGDEELLQFGCRPRRLLRPGVLSWREPSGRWRARPGCGARRPRRTASLSARSRGARICSEWWRDRGRWPPDRHREVVQGSGIEGLESQMANGWGHMTEEVAPVDRAGAWCDARGDEPLLEELVEALPGSLDACAVRERTQALRFSSTKWAPTSSRPCRLHHAEHSQQDDDQQDADDQPYDVVTTHGGSPPTDLVRGRLSRHRFSSRHTIKRFLPLRLDPRRTATFSARPRGA